MVIAPEHPIAKELCVGDNKQAAFDYIAAAGKKTEFERSDAEREKTGVFTGAYAIDPVNERRIPIWISDYVLSTYGTGAIMVGVFATTDVDSCKQSITDYLKNLKQTVQSYSPDEVFKIDNAIIEDNGKEVIVVVCNDIETAKKEVDSLLGK